VVSTPPVPPGGSDDLDPTGIRALLSSLPDPGPMPADLVDRINASIAAEQAARQHPSVVPMRTRRWGWQHVGAVAAAAAVIGLGLPALLTGTGPGDVMASLSGRGSAADSASGSAASLTDRSEAGAPATQAVPSADQRAGAAVGAVALGASGTAYTTAALATQARARLSTALDSAASAAKPLGAGAADTESGLRACLTALGVQAWVPVHGDVATLDGAPAVVALVGAGTGQTVYAVSPDCDASHPSVLAGPLPLP
jgi:hypothetical protein